MVPFSEWPLENGIIAPIPIHLTNILGVASPANPPMSGPLNGCPLKPWTQAKEHVKNVKRPIVGGDIQLCESQPESHTEMWMGCEFQLTKFNAIGTLMAKCSQFDRLSPLQVAENLWLPIKPALLNTNGLLSGLASNIPSIVALA